VSSRFSRGGRRLRPADIGLGAVKLFHCLIHLGHNRLLPEGALKELALVEGRAHSLIEFPFLNGPGQSLPNTKLVKVADELNELEGDFWQATIIRFHSLLPFIIRHLRIGEVHCSGGLTGNWFSPPRSPRFER